MFWEDTKTLVVRESGPEIVSLLTLMIQYENLKVSNTVHYRAQVGKHNPMSVIDLVLPTTSLNFIVNKKLISCFQFVCR